MALRAAVAALLACSGQAFAGEAIEDSPPPAPGARVVVVAHFVQWWEERIGPPPPALANDSLATLVRALEGRGLHVIPYSEYEEAITRASPGCSSESFHKPHLREPDGASMNFMEGPHPDRCLRDIRRTARRLGAEYIVLSGADYEVCPGVRTGCIQTVTVDYDPANSRHKKFEPIVDYVWGVRRDGPASPPGATPLEQYAAALAVAIARGY